MSSNEKVKAIMIFEVLGRPPEHLKDTLNKIIDAIGSEKGVEVVEKKVNEPVPIKDKEQFFSDFAEIEVELDGIFDLSLLVFKYMPAHVDVISPENIKITNNQVSGVFNEIARRLHGYDEIARIIQIEKSILEKKLKSLLEEKTKKKKPEKDKKD
ncbi:MAG TPA: hypothetical protein VJ438_01955 [Candidatus Nanoarchaeia archaeon]|nr:hypothetical protein [Candidatus Nanoarchaeia archaeon]